MNTLKNTSLLDVSMRDKSSHVPIWLMRQAGRYLPQYQKIREKYDFLTMIHEPDIAAEITVQPIEEFSLDAAILFSDILTIPEALQLGLVFDENGPIIQKPIYNERMRSHFLEFKEEDIIDNLEFVSNAIKNTKERLNNRVPLIGFAGSPFTVLAYMVEGKSTKSWSKIKKLMYTEKEIFEKLMIKMAKITSSYLSFQINSGVDAIQIFDSWAGMIALSDYQEYSWKYIKIIIDDLKKYSKPVFVFLKGIHQNLKDIITDGPDVLNLDWGIPIENIQKETKGEVVLQGNLDPGILYGSRESIRKAAIHILKNAGEYHIFNLGHGIYPDTPVDSVKILVDTVHQFKK